MMRAFKLQLSEVTLHGLESGHGPLLLMLHGFPEYSGIWRPFIENLSDRFRVVAPDLRGYNLSSQPEDVGAYALEKLMGDVLELIEKLGAEQVFLVGHDWGGMLAWYLAAHRPEVFSRLVILNAPHPKVYQKLFASDADQKSKATYIGMLLKPGSENVLAENDYQRLKASMFESSPLAFPAEEREGMLEAWRRGLRGPIHYYRSYIPQQERLVSEMPRVQIPTLVLWGEQDHALSLRNLEGLDAYVADLKIVRYPDASHWLVHEISAELSLEIRNFCIV